MAEITMRGATAEFWDDAVHALTGGGDGPRCWCQWWLMSNAEFQSLSPDDKRDRLRNELSDATLAPALLAYVNGSIAGWVRVGPRTDQTRLARTQLVKSGTGEPLDDPDVWAITCIVVRKEHRGEGVMGALVDAAVVHAREHGARVVEAYPVDTLGRRAAANSLYHGVASVFADAGFRDVSRPKPNRPVMALDLDAGAA